MPDIVIRRNVGTIDWRPLIGVESVTPALAQAAVQAVAAAETAEADAETATAAKVAAELAQAAAEAAAAEATEISGIDTLDEGNAALIDNETSLTRQRLSDGFVSVSEAPLDPRRYGVKQDGVTDDTAAMQAAINALPVGGELRIPAASATLELTAPLDIPASGVTITGAGLASRIAYRADNYLFPLTNRRNVRISSLRVSHYGTTGGVFDLSNSFRCSVFGVVMDGLHYNDPTAPGQPRTGQRAIRLRDNAGDNRLLDLDINNFGVGVETSAIMNFLNSSVLGTCHTGVLAAAGNAGMQIGSTSFTSSPGRTAYNIHIPVAANAWWLDDLWTEGADVAVMVGAAGAGPTLFSLGRSKLAATTRCLDLVVAGMSTLQSLQFSVNPGATPDPIRVASNQGYAAELLNDQGSDIPATVFPKHWTYFPRYDSGTALVGGRHVHIGAGLAAGQASYYEAGGGRARVGYDGTRVIVSDAGGGRSVALRAGAAAAARNLLTAGADGNWHLGEESASANNMAKGGFVANALAQPTGNPSGGGYLFAWNGALYWRGPNGTVTTVAPA